MGVKIVPAEPVSLTSWVIVVLLVVLSVLGAIITYRSSWRISGTYNGADVSTKEKAGFLVAGVGVGLILAGLYLVGTASTSSVDASNATYQAIEDNYGVVLQDGGREISSLRESDSGTIQEVDFIADGELYRGRIEILEDRVTLLVQEDVQNSQYVEYGTNSVTPQNSVQTPQKDVLWMLVLVLLLSVSAGVWAARSFFRDEDSSVLFSLFMGVLVAVFVALLLMLAVSVTIFQIWADENREELFSRVEESYGVENMQAAGEGTEYQVLDGVYDVSFVENDRVREGFLWTTEEGMTALVMLPISDGGSEYIEFDKELVG